MQTRKINKNQLLAGDIIVSTTDALASGVIRAGSGASVSHSMLYIGNSNVIEAISSGVERRSLKRALNDATLAIALRRREITPAIRTAVVRHAAEYENRRLPYDYTGAAGAGLSDGRGLALSAAGCSVSRNVCFQTAAKIAVNASPLVADKMFFCSELVARVFELANASLTDRAPSFTTPRHIRTSTKLLYLGHLKDT